MIQLEEVLQQIGKAGVIVTPKKVQFVVPCISFLGHLVLVAEVLVNPNRTKAKKKISLAQ